MQNARPRERNSATAMPHAAYAAEQAALQSAAAAHRRCRRCAVTDLEAARDVR